MRALAGLLVLLLVGVARAAPAPFVAVLVAGDDSLPVFDNATDRMAALLTADGTPSGAISRFSARAGQPMRGRVLDAIAALRPAPGQACLVFMTSHGAHGPGIYLAPRDEFLSPADLAAALSKGCRAAPTVAILSACYTGNFARAPVVRPNRVILTAARADRPSFGCGAGRVFTVYDSCLLGTLEQHPSGWPAAVTQTDACVTQAETQDDELASEPQSYFGPAAAVPLP